MRSNNRRLLIVTQSVDAEDPILGFFVRWIMELAKHFERVEVVCLKEGKHALPQNVRVHSLGKERGARTRTAYAFSFLCLAWNLRREYDAVFVHMNQEYVLIAGLLWRLLRKPVYLWRNHYAGSWATDLAAVFCTKVFCTSKRSYTATYKKTELMPVGIDTERFKPDAGVSHIPRSILFLARIAPSKRPELLIDALIQLAREGVEFTADIVGSPQEKDRAFYASLKERAQPLGERVRFLPEVANEDTPRLYQSHEIFVNASPSGMFDKTIFEAAASGCLVLAASEDFAKLAGPEAFFSSARELAAHLEAMLGTIAAPMPDFVRNHSLTTLADKLVQAIGTDELQP